MTTHTYHHISGRSAGNNCRPCPPFKAGECVSLTFDSSGRSWPSASGLECPAASSCYDAQTLDLLGSDAAPPTARPERPATRSTILRRRYFYLDHSTVP